MRVSSRLLLSLLPVVAAVMSLYTMWALREREAVMLQQTRQELSAYAIALSISVEEAMRGGRGDQVQEVINRITREPSIYGILVYDGGGRLVFASDTLIAPGSASQGDLRDVLQSGRAAMLEREIDEQSVFSMVLPIHSAAGGIAGALEVARPSSEILRAKKLVRRRYLLNTITLLVTLSLVTLWIVRRTVADPMRRLLDGVRAVGRGDLGHRVGPMAGGGELTELAREFNSMATSVETARQAAHQDASDRIALERRLRESERMAAMGTLAAGLAHEIAAPLNVASGRAELLLARQVSADERERHLRSIVAEVGRITTIVRNLLAVARNRAIQVRPVTVADVVEAAVEVVEGDLRRLAITVERTGDHRLAAMADPDLLHQILVNLLTNAVQALETSDGTRTIMVHAAPVAGAAGVSLEVHDSGPGVPFELRQRVFDPFFSTKPTGTGLGLALAHNMAEAQGARLDLAPHGPLPGASFRLVLPQQSGSIDD